MFEQPFWIAFTYSLTRDLLRHHVVISFHVLKISMSFLKWQSLSCQPSWMSDNFGGAILNCIQPCMGFAMTSYMCSRSLIIHHLVEHNKPIVMPWFGCLDSHLEFQLLLWICGSHLKLHMALSRTCHDIMYGHVVIKFRISRILSKMSQLFKELYLFCFTIFNFSSSHYLYFQLHDALTTY